MRGLRRFDSEIKGFGDARSHLFVGRRGFAIEHSVADEVPVMLEGFHRAAQGYSEVQADPIGDEIRLLRGVSEDGTTNVAAYIVDGPLLYRIGGSSPAGAGTGAFDAGCWAASTVTSPRHTTAVPREMEPTLFIPKSPRVLVAMAPGAISASYLICEEYTPNQLATWMGQEHMTSGDIRRHFGRKTRFVTSCSTPRTAARQRHTRARGARRP